jgi:AcrR family transcriptional regulator
MMAMADTIKEVAVDLFYRKGYFATSISEIARGCGIQKASIYYHFPGKEELLFCIMDTTMSDLMAYLQRNLAKMVSVEQKMRAAVHSHVTFHLNRQKETFIASSELRGLTPPHYDAIVAQRDAYESIFQDLIREGIALDVFAPGDIKILSYAILTLCTAGASWFNPQGRLSVDGIAGIYETFILNGLQAGAQWLPTRGGQRHEKGGRNGLRP